MNTKEKLKLILQEWLEYNLPDTYTRNFDMSYLKHDEILSIIGARRAGKTHLCYQIIKELRKNTNIPPHNILYINFEDERLYPLNGDELTLLLDIYLEAFDVDMEKQVYLFVDEIHNIDNWSKWARRINERYKNIKLIITGSSAKLLSREIATELRGRTISFNIFPLSFAEYVSANNITFNPKKILYSQERFKIKKLFNNYVQNGGFPATFNALQPEKLLKEYYEVMFYRDIVERHRVTNIKLLEDYLALLIDQTACKFSISKTAVKLQEFGYSFSKSTLSNFLNYAEESQLIFPVKKYSFKLREQMRSPQKIYTIDHGLLQTIRFGFMENIGRLLENIVYLELRRSNEAKNIFYYQENKECDFLTQQKNKVTNAIQVSQNISSAETKKREIEGLLEAMQALNLKSGWILTEDEKDSIKVNGCLIEVVPIWYWLLTR